MFHKHVLQGMLETSDFNAVDDVSFFVGALVDTFCGLSSIAEVTTTLTEYIDIVNFVFRRHKSFEWTKEATELFEIYIESFMKKARTAFRNYEASEQLTEM